MRLIRDRTIKNKSKQSIVINIILLLIGVDLSLPISVDTKLSISNNQSEECRDCNEVCNADFIK